MERPPRSRYRPHAAFGRRLRELRKQSSLLQAELAKLAGVSPTYVGAVERGQFLPSERVLAALARTLRAYGVVVDDDELLGLAGYAGYRPPPADVVAVDDAEKTPLLRWLARLPIDALVKLQNVAISIGLESYDPETGERVVPGALRERLERLAPPPAETPAPHNGDDSRTFQES